MAWRNNEVVEQHIRISRWLLDRIEFNAKDRKLTKLNEWWKEAAEHYLNSSAIATNERWVGIITTIETECCNSTCKKKIPEGTFVLYYPPKGVLCPMCFVQRFGDKARVANILKDLEMKENLRVMTETLKEKTKALMFLNQKEKLDQLLTQRMEIKTLSDDILRKNDEVLNFALDYFRRGYEPTEQKIAFDKLKKETDMLEEEREKLKREDEALEPLVRHVEDFNKREIEQRIRKKKSLDEESIEES